MAEGAPIFLESWARERERERQLTGEQIGKNAGLCPVVQKAP